MSEQLATTQETSVVQTTISDIVTLSKEYQPKMELASSKAIAAMKEITAIEDDEDREYVNKLLVNVRDAYNTINDMRTKITKPIDQLKAKFMEYEKPLGDSDKNSEYNRVRNLMAQYDQEKINKRKRQEEEAARKKERANHLTDIGAAILTNLHNLVMAKIKKGDEDSAAYFKASTLENFDKRAEDYKKHKPYLKTEEFLACFNVPYKKNLFTEEEYKDIISTIAKEQPIELWNEELQKLAAPILNEWKAKIPGLKQNLIDLKNAKDESERNRLAAEQEAAAKEEESRRHQSLQQQLFESTAEVANQASLSKLENEFVEQATTTELGDTGPTKLVLKFTDPKLSLKALSNIMYHCMGHKDFPGIQKRDKAKKLVFDAQGRPEYIEAVQWWINFFLANCDAHIEGTIVTEDAKVIVKK